MAIRVESSKDKSVRLRTVTIDLAEAGFRTALLNGLTVEDTVTTERATDRVRIVVQDRATGFAGSLWVPVATK